MFNKYFIEIKNRLILILICWSFLFFISYLNKEILLFLTVKPNLSLDEKFYFIATGVVEIFNSYLALTYFISFQCSLYIVYLHTIMFFSPALYKFEQKKINTLFLISFILWLIGNCVFNFLTLPICWDFFVSFQGTSLNFVNIFLELRVEKYLEMYYKIYYLNIFVLQLVLVFFVFVDSLTNKIVFVKKTRKPTYFLLIIVSTCITPPDVLSQLTLFGFLFCFFEIGIIILILKRNFFNLANS
tara:strand:+ start:1474 stop:2202 length:729 start_codon:yes stop_codon:yes gene_type:complete